MKNKMNPLKNGKETILKIKVIDADKAFDFIGKHILNKVDFDNYGFSIEQMYLDEDRYKESLKDDLKEEVIREIENYGNKMVKSIVDKIK